MPLLRVPGNRWNSICLARTFRRAIEKNSQLSLGKERKKKARRQISTYIVLRSNLSLPVASDNRDALEDIHPDAGDIAKEEERKDTSGNTEAAQNGTASHSPSAYFEEKRGTPGFLTI